MCSFGTARCAEAPPCPSTRTRCDRRFPDFPGACVGGGGGPLLGSANAETTPGRAPAAAADRTQRPDATCEGKNGWLSRAP